MSDLDLRDLDAFVAVARTRNFRRAAIEQRVSVSSLSQRLRDMEERLGVRLMNRTTRSVALTQAGELLLARVGPAISDVGAALDQVRGLRAVPSGRLASMRRRRRSIWCWRRWSRRFLQRIPRSIWRSSAKARSSISWPAVLMPACVMASIWRRT